MIRKIKNSLKKRNVKIFLVFLFCSTSAWFISNLSESYTGHAELAFEFTNESDDLLLIGASQDKIDAQLEAGGFQFLGFSFKAKEVNIDLSKVSKDGDRYYLTKEQLRPQIEKQLPNSVRLIDMAVDSLFFDFQEVISKEVPVDPQVTLKLAQNHILDGKLDVAPSVIVVKGPRNEVDTITVVKSIPLALTELTTNFSHTVDLVIPQGLRYTSFSATSVTVGGAVARFSEKIVATKIKAINLPAGTSVKMFPDAVEVLCKGTITALKGLQGSDIEVVADFSSSNRQATNTVRLKLVEQPEHLSSIALQQSTVEYILKREK